MDKLIEKLINRRTQLDVTQSYLSELSGISLRAINKIENGQTSPTISTISKLADVLGMELRLEIKTVENK